MNSRGMRLILGCVLGGASLFVVGCGGSAGASANTTAQNGTVGTAVSDATTEDWATIGVKILSISLVPQGGGTNVNIYTAQSPAPVINLVQLDQLGELLGNLTVPVGTYTGAVLTISGNPGDVLLTAAADPAVGFAGTAGATVPSAQILIQGTTGTAPNLTVPVNVTFVSPLAVAASQTSFMDLEFNLSHPSFLVGHTLLAAGSTLWAVNFNGPVHHHPIADITKFLLRHTYGTVSAVSSDNTSITIAKDFPVEPATAPETAVASNHSLQILADSTNGTIYYDVDAKTNVTIMNFSTVAVSLPTKFVRIATRYQANGTLVAVRVWASSTFNSLWISPEGHVVHTDTTTNVVTVQNELGVGVPVTVNASTQFFLRTPGSAAVDATPIATGLAFLTAHNLVRGFKVHATVVDTLAAPLVAQTIDIETAKYDGVISAATANGFVYTRNFTTALDNYVFTANYIASTSANGTDSLGNAIVGFKWWNFTFPTVITSGSGAVNSFIAATNGGVSFGGTVATISAAAQSSAKWADPANLTGWSVPVAVLMPTAVPLGVAATGYSTGAFTMTVPGGAAAVPVTLSTVAGSGTLVFQVDRTGGVVTMTSVDITAVAGQNTVTTNLLATTPVTVFGVPQANGSIKAYEVFYYTGTKPVSID